jgi:hypothetical protein
MRLKQWSGATAIALAILFAAALPAEEGSNAQAATNPVPGKVVAGAFQAQGKNYKIDSEDFMLRPGEGMEVKYHLQKGAVMVYGWKASGNLRFEFHGEPDQKPNKEYYERYELNDQGGADHAFGSFTAPTTGVHGWFWENKTDKEVEMHLNTAGFYDVAKMSAGEAPEELPIEDPK